MIQNGLQPLGCPNIHNMIQNGLRPLGCPNIHNMTQNGLRPLGCPNIHNMTQNGVQPLGCPNIHYSVVNPQPIHTGPILCQSYPKPTRKTIIRFPFGDKIISLSPCLYAFFTSGNVVKPLLMKGRRDSSWALSGGVRLILYISLYSV